jgi:hypothetical protein
MAPEVWSAVVEQETQSRMERWVAAEAWSCSASAKIPINTTAQTRIIREHL